MRGPKSKWTLCSKCCPFIRCSSESETVHWRRRCCVCWEERAKRRRSGFFDDLSEVTTHTHTIYIKSYNVSQCKWRRGVFRGWRNGNTIDRQDSCAEIQLTDSLEWVETVEALRSQGPRKRAQDHPVQLKSINAALCWD